jgi:hypothetical protein
LLVFLVSLNGCNRSPPSYHVSGTVLFKGQPLPAGEIFFEPDASKGNQGPQGYAVIKEGKYDTAVTKRGIKGGPYNIRIEGFDGRPSNELPMGKPLFANSQEKRDLPQVNSEQNFSVNAPAP